MTTTPDAQLNLVKLFPITDHRMWDQFNEQNLVQRFAGPL